MVFEKMTMQEKRKAYKKAIESGDVIDSFDGFCQQMYKSIFDTKTFEPIEVYWGIVYIRRNT